MQNAKWADRVITHVRYEGTGRNKRIVALAVHTDYGTRLGDPVVMTKQAVIDAIRLQHLTFVTAPPGNNGVVQRGADVHVVRIRNVDYIRTDANSIEVDNLGDLPEF